MQSCKHCRSCGTKGHYEKVCMKKSTHLVGVPGTSTNSDPDYFDEHGEPVYAHALMVHTKAINKKKHLIQFPISVNLEKVRKPVEGPCPTVLLKADTGADVNLLNSTTFNKIIGDRSLLQPSTLRMEAYGNSTVAVLGKFHAFLRWKGRIYRQLFFHHYSQCITLFTLQRWLLHFGSTQALLLCENIKKFQQIPKETSSETYTAYNWPQPIQDAWYFITSFGKWRNWWGEAVSFHSAVSLQGATSRLYHWRSRTSLECTHMSSQELGSFQDLHTSSSSNQMQSQLDMHQDEFQSIYRKLSTRKSGTWND